MVAAGFRKSLRQFVAPLILATAVWFAIYPIRWLSPKIYFHGESRSNQTHQSTTDPEALLARKGAGKEAKLSYGGNVLMENRNGLVADVETMQADGKAKRDAEVVMIASVAGTDRITVGADKGCGTKGSVADVRALNATAQVAQKKYSAVDGRTTRHEGYTISQQKRQVWPTFAALTADKSDQLRRWIEEATRCPFGPVVRFASGLQKDISAVAAAVDTSWSTGQVNRLKMIKRQMYGLPVLNSSVPVSCPSHLR